MIEPPTYIHFPLLVRLLDDPTLVETAEVRAEDGYSCPYIERGSSFNRLQSAESGAINLTNGNHPANEMRGLA